MSEMDDFQVVLAERLSVPILASLSGTSGSGKTYSGLLLAAGLAAGGKVGMVDAENGRGTLYQDDPDISKALPNSYLYTQISAPYTPIRYVKALRAMENAGASVALIDSTTHEWEGEGGCTDIAENNKLKGMPNWAMAKKEHKRFMAYLLSSRMHIIPCLRAREKVKITPDNKVIPQGIQPVAEKNFVFEMLVSLMFDEATHHYSNVKMPKMLAGIFKGGELITRAHGEALLEWSKGGRAVDPDALLVKRARSAAELGMADYSEFFKGLTKAEQRYLASPTGGHEENKRTAAKVDERDKAESVDGSPAQRLATAQAHPNFAQVLGTCGYEMWSAVPPDKHLAILAEVESELANF